MSKIDGDASVAASKPGSFGDSALEIKKRASGSGSGGGSKDDPARSDSMEKAAERISNVKLEGSPFGEKLTPGKPKSAGPSLLSQQAHAQRRHPSSPEASNPPPYTEGSTEAPPPLDGHAAPMSSSAMSVDAQLPVLDGTEKITVKIADLGNGA